MDYDFYKFTPKEFENLVQSLFQSILEKKSISYGIEPDGARELSYEGRVDFPNKADSWISISVK